MWVTRYLNDVFHKRMVITHCKNLCKGDVLIDDRGKNDTSEFEGEWIQFGSKSFPDWDTVLTYLIPKENYRSRLMQQRLITLDLVSTLPGL